MAGSITPPGYWGQYDVPLWPLLEQVRTCRRDGEALPAMSFQLGGQNPDVQCQESRAAVVADCQRHVEPAVTRLGSKSTRASEGPMSCHLSPLTQESETSDESLWHSVMWDHREPGYTSKGADKVFLSANEAAPEMNLPNFQDLGICSPGEAAPKQKEDVTRILELASQILEGWVRCESDSSDDEYWDDYPC